MKKYYLLYFGTFCLWTSGVNAQYTVLHNFIDTTSYYPFGSLTFSGGKLYGITSAEPPTYGAIFVIDTNGSNYRKLLTFDGTTGNNIYGYNFSFTTSGYKLCGMTSNGPVFSIDTNGGGYKAFVSLPSGAAGSLTLSGNKLYGVSRNGGTGDGNIFSVDTNDTGYRDLHDFTMDTTASYASNSLVLSGSKLFGTTLYGGAYNLGVIYSMDTDGNNYKELFDFDGTNGEGPTAALTLSISGDTLFGMTSSLETGSGNIFSIDTDGSGYMDLFTFGGTNGKDPFGSLTLSGNKLYGMTYIGGANGGGNIFSIHTNGSGFEDLVDFDGMSFPLGGGPYGSLILYGDKFYGMTAGGGTNDYGVIFSFRDTTANTTNSINTISVAAGSINLYPNPNNGQFTLSLSNIPNSYRDEKSAGGRTSCNIEIYNVLGEKVLSETLQPQTPKGALININLTGQPGGVYFYRVMGEDGSLVGEGKVVVE